MISRWTVVPSIILFTSASPCMDVKHCRIRAIWRMVLIMVVSMVRMGELWPLHPPNYTVPLHKRCQIVCLSNMTSSGMLFFYFTYLMIFARHPFAVRLFVFVALSLSVLYFFTVSFVLKMAAMLSALFLFFSLPTGRPSLLCSCV